MLKQNRTEHEINVYEMRSDFFSVRWDRIKFLFCVMRQNQILILWDEIESNSHFVKWDEIRFFFVRWDEMRSESSFYEMKLNFCETECLILILWSVYTWQLFLTNIRECLILLSFLLKCWWCSWFIEWKQKHFEFRVCCLK